MTSEQKSAIAKLIIAWVKADGSLQDKEIEIVNRTNAKYGIHRPNYADAHEMDFGDALRILSEIESSTIKAELVQTIHSLIMCDGRCNEKEAVLLIALKYVLLDDFSNECSIISSSDISVNIDYGKILYVEIGYDADVNADIQKNFRVISNDMAVAGLDFVYIPEVIEGIRQMNPANMKYIIRVLAPQLAEGGQEDLYMKICSADTSVFCKELLVHRFGLSSLFGAAPAILLKIGASEMKSYYLHIVLNENVLDDIQSFVNLYRELTENNTITLIQTLPGRKEFVYEGFYKTFFNIMMSIPTEKRESRIVIDPYNKSVAFTDIGVNLYDMLSLKQLALYSFIIRQSIMGSPKEVQYNPVSKNISHRQDDIFGSIYAMFGKDDLSDFTVALTPNIAKIKKAIMEIGNLKLKEQYFIKRNRKEMTLRVEIAPSKVYIKDRFGRELLMTDSEEWINL